MNRSQIVDEVLARGPVPMPAPLKKTLMVLAGLGLIATIAGLLVGHAAWSVTALLVATLIVAGLSQAGIVWSAVFQITNARWGRSYRRLLELTLMGAPVALLGLVILMATSGFWAPFAHHHLEGGKAIWLSLPFWAARNLIGVLGLFVLSAYYLYHCLRPDLGIARERGQVFAGRLTERLTRNWAGEEAEVARAARKRDVLAPILCIAYAVVYSMVGFDLVMGLDIYWYSTLFGAYHFIANVYMSVALAILLAAAFKKGIAPAGFFSAKHFGLMGVLLFAFCFLMGDFFWSQFLTIWYGDLPEETHYVLLRTMNPELPWRYLAWAVLIAFFGIPFLSLMFRAVKWVPARVGTISVVVILAIILERFLTAAPPLLGLEAGAGLGEMLLPLALATVASIGFVALGGLLYAWLMVRVPLLPIGDPLVAESLKDSEERPR